jgi:3',5'-cyclic AMP phosphodiesterase CpdA
VTLIPAFNWLHAPANRDIIARWTAEARTGHALELPGPPDPDRFEFLVLGDTGDSDVVGGAISPQDAVARELAADAFHPDGSERARLVLHVGDVVYMTGERRLYDRNFRRPYAPFLTPDSTFERLVFRLPFLPVPGNHDYYDVPRWAELLARAPMLGDGFRTVARELFAFSIPRGGSDMGRAYMEAFVAPPGNGAAPRYEPSRETRLPNRYYRFQFGSVDFFALDSNTLDGFPPTVAEQGVRRGAARDVAGLRTLAREIDEKLRREQAAVAAWRDTERRALAADPARVALLAEVVQGAAGALGRMADALRPQAAAGEPGAQPALAAAERAHGAWMRGEKRIARATAGSGPPRARAILAALPRLDHAFRLTHEAQRAFEELLVHTPEGDIRRALLAARDEVQAAVERWSVAAADLPPEEMEERIAQLSETALDIQRKLARETRRLRYRADDYDAAQLEWLDAALAESQRDRPSAWRIVYLHHPLFTSVRSYCEGPEIQEIRENLCACLRGRVDAVFSGHAHAFEWIRSRTLPEMGQFVTGGGGQVTLGRSVLEPRRVERYRRRVRALADAGVTEVAHAGRGPQAVNWAAGSVYHYLHVSVTPEALKVRPVGVRRVAGDYRREIPMPVHHVPELTRETASWASRRLEWVEVRRGEPPRPHWA